MAMKLDVLALDGVFDTGLSTVLDVFTTANELAAMLQLDVAPFEVTVTGVRKRVRTSQGLTVPVARALDAGSADWLIVPALGCKMPETLEPALCRPDVRDACAALQERASKSANLAAACIGTFVLAESGVLDQDRKSVV